MELTDYLNLYIGGKCFIRIQGDSKEGTITHSLLQQHPGNGIIKVIPICRFIVDMQPEEAIELVKIARDIPDDKIKDYRITYCAASDGRENIHKDVFLIEVEHFVNHPGIKQWRKSFMIELCFDSMDLTLREYYNAGKEKQGDLAVYNQLKCFNWLIKKRFWVGDMDLIISGDVLIINEHTN